MNIPTNKSKKDISEAFSVLNGVLFDELLYKDENSDAVVASIYECLKRGKRLKKCELCGKWFFPVKDNREKYCSRITYGGKSCMEYSATARETKRRSNSEIERKLHSVRQTFDNCGRFVEKDTFNEGVKEERKKYNLGLISEADFLIWIEENRGRKNKGGGRTSAKKEYSPHRAVD